DGMGIDRRAEGDGGEERELMGAVIAFDIEGRIRLGITETLRLGEALLKGQPFALHAREDIIAGAVEDAVDAADRIAGERFTQRLDDRDTAGGRGFEIEAD